MEDWRMRMIRVRTYQKQKRTYDLDYHPARRMEPLKPAQRAKQEQPSSPRFPRANRPTPLAQPAQSQPPRLATENRAVQAMPSRPQPPAAQPPASQPFEESDVFPLEPAPDELEGWQRKCAPPEYGPTTQLGPNLRLQARRGHRAGVIELRPGLYLVAEVPAEALQRPEFGAAFLVPLVTSVAVEALKQPATQQALQRVVQAGVQLVTPQVAGPTSWPLALPEPPKTPAIPNLPWATPDDIAGTFGCDGYASGHCPCKWRHR